MKTSTTILLAMILASFSNIAFAQTTTLDPEAAKEFKPGVASDDSSIKSRAFRFVYGATLTELEPGAKVRVWIPMATSNHEQDVALESTSLPGRFQETKDAKFGNTTIYFEAVANEKGEVPMEVSYRIIRRELTELNREVIGKENAAWLQATAMVPNDEKLRKAVLSDDDTKGETIDVAKKLYLGVGKHMKYDKPADKPGWGLGDSQFACEKCYGNCTDFHSLFISAALNLKIPSRFEIGFPIPEERGSGVVGGYHCWAKFQSDNQWIPVDISEADKNPDMEEYYFGNLTADRVTFSVGRDLELQPSPAAGPINYLAYPYAEVDGKPHKKFRKEFGYEDIDVKDK
jgi:transglutaminase-like putative cysteine protease